MTSTTSFTRTILVTGGAGFIGSNYLNHMVPKYPHYRYVNVDSLTSIASLDNLEVSTAMNYVFVKSDIRDRDALKAVFRDYAVTHIIHFAAESHVDVSIQNPNIFIETNVMGTQHLLALAKEYDVKRFHHISTDEVYGSLSATAIPFTEESQIAPNNPYSASKAASEMFVRAYHRTFGLDTVITRCSNNYGPHQDRTKLIPLFTLNLLAGATVPLYGSGENVRDWIYVDDHVRAIDLVFHSGTSGEVYNVGGNNEVRNIDIVKRLIELTDRNAQAIEMVPDRLGHDFRYAIDASKIQSELGWVPETSFEEGLAGTVEYYRTLARS